ncbi:glucosamine-6-phosphate deaminase [Savagea sp. SN6]|uniref:Glucosamine-6-phosphate deaminase n=1 Tax=Savagea serpentis TaxID=2785297 RepID=A0A8J7KCD6_9BACL|nr:glucosamine-6-phosphate deaminase [Savagea serpentis]MBF4501337.1 glucosamine-6-phosphate deaminase [Savagea serpentis]
MTKLNVVRVNNESEAAQYVHEYVKNKLQNETLQTIGLATGSTMIPIYKCWVESTLDFSEVTAFNLDEYVGLSKDNPNSYAYFMNEHLFQHKPFKQTFIPDGLAEDPEEECERYEQLLQEHPLDLQLLGVGENGHIAFNEPETPIDSITHVAKLTDSTLSVNGQYFDNAEKMPDIAFTMGIESILRAKSIILIAFGEKKRAAIEKLLEGKVDVHWTITYLLTHPDVTVITDLQA